MAGEFEKNIVRYVIDMTGWSLAKTPDWLMRPGKAECGPNWPLVKAIYRDLTELELPDAMPSRERRKIDAVFVDSKGQKRLFEVDEVQHFNSFRATTLEHYPADLLVAFDRAKWMSASRSKNKLEGGGFARPCAPLFPMDGGRHRQRAFRDALADILPPHYGFLPTLRFAHFDIHGPLVRRKVEVALAEKLS
ncbi:hypothetical protein [Novosphingobium sp. PY1]|uniref:hypothetical protein n=1 Tax=Novosphingobium sp. PY1 TaxID=1882221 RepID=UPI001A8EC002|nr:hypothetical protein [Novosphingobium sp. PY1]GFM28600.1 uncharacterized protein PY1_contig-04-648 [Novosphingobium sp. PY1]